MKYHICQTTTSVLPHVEARLPLFVPDQDSVLGELPEELRRWRTTRNRPTRIPRKFVFTYMVDLKGKIQLLL